MQRSRRLFYIDALSSLELFLFFLVLSFAGGLISFQGLGLGVAGDQHVYYRHRFFKPA